MRQICPLYKKEPKETEINGLRQLGENNNKNTENTHHFYNAVQ